MSTSSLSGPNFPRPPLLMAGGMVGLALLAALLGRVAGAAPEAPHVAAITARDLRFEDRGDGAVLVYDADQQQKNQHASPIEVATGQNGFLRGTLRGFARARRADGIGDEAPFRLTAWADGRLTLEDPATGRRAELEAFGATNEAVFARLLVPPGRATAVP